MPTHAEAMKRKSESLEELRKSFKEASIAVVTDTRGDAAGTRALIAILLAHRTMAAAALITAMDRAVTSGCLDPETVIIDARRHISALTPAVPIGGLARYDRPPPSLTDYDDLLTGSES